MFPLDFFQRWPAPFLLHDSFRILRFLASPRRILGRKPIRDDELTKLVVAERAAQRVDEGIVTLSERGGLCIRTSGGLEPLEVRKSRFTARRCEELQIQLCLAWLQRILDRDLFIY